MKRTILLFALVAACHREAPPPSTLSPVQPPQSVESGESTVARITAADLQKRLGTVTIIDVRHADNYAFAHIPGALHIPLSFIEQEAPYLPKEKPIITYCT